MKIHFAGRSCRFPGASSMQDFEDLLYKGRCAVSETPENRWRHSEFAHPVPGTPGRTYSFAAGTIDHQEHFDPAVFGISPREAEYMDPQQRVLLHVVREALEDACLKPSDLAGQTVGVFIGASMTDHGNMVAKDPRLTDAYMMTGNALAVIANRISHVFDFNGPSMTIDTACSSSLFALEAAEKALRAGQVDIAIVGATNVLLYPINFVGFSAARMLSPSGKCQAFSANADGYVRSEGMAAVVLRRAEDGEELPRSYGTLVGVGVNTSGHTVNIAVPSNPAQYALLTQTYERLGVDPDDLAFVEAHGTGTAVGDPIEADALGRALAQKRSSPLPIGSVKSNIGHLEPAAGMAGLLKALVALERGELPATLHAEELNPDIPFAALGLAVAQTPVPLPDTPGPRLAGISSFGFGGANAHAIIAGPEPVRDAAPPAPAEGPARDILLTSTFCEASLKASATHYADLIETLAPADRDQLADELLHWRDLAPHRLAVLTKDPALAAEALRAHANGHNHPAAAQARSTLVDAETVFTFSGNGAQYDGMSRAAYGADPVFRATYDEISAGWEALTGTALVDEMNAPDLGARLQVALTAQVLLFADQVAMARAVMARGMIPAAVLGHSGGEVAAAHLAGALPLDQALALIKTRATWQEEVAGRGTMAALLAPEAEAREALTEFADPLLSIAAINSPKSVTLAGPTEAIDAFSKKVRAERRWACVKLKINYPYHSALLDAFHEPLMEALDFITPQPLTIPFLSSVTGTALAHDEIDASYWWHNIRDSVNYLGALQTAVGMGLNAYIEIGPDPVLTSYIRDSFSGQPTETSVTFAARKTDTAEVNPVLRAVARGLVHGCKVDRLAFSQPPRRASGLLAPYPWQNRSYSIFDVPEIGRLVGRGEDWHPLLGKQEALDSHVWTAEIDAHLQPVMADHMVAGKSVLPGAALAELCMAAAQRVLETGAVELRDLDMMSMVPLMPRSIADLRTQAVASDHRVRVSTRARFSRDPFREHAQARFAALTGDAPVIAPPDRATAGREIPGDHLYRRMREIGLTYGPMFQRVARYWRVGADVVEVQLKDDVLDGFDPADWALDPVGMDAVLHGIAGLLEGGSYADRGIAFVPIRIGRIKLWRPGQRLASGRIEVTRRGQRSVVANVTFFDAGGAVVATATQLRLRAIELAPLVDFTRQVFATDLAPIDPAGRAPALELPAPETLVAGASAPLTDADGTLAETIALLDATALSIAHEALSAIIAGQDRIAAPAGASRELAGWIETATGWLESAGLARRDGDGTVRLIAGLDLPDPDAMIAGIMAERPEFGSELALLARLRRALPELIAGEVSWSLEAVYGRAALENLAAGSVSGQRRAGWLAQELAAITAALPTDRPVRVAELAYGAPRALPLLVEARPDVAFAMTLLPARPAGAPAAPDPGGKVGPLPLALVDMGNLAEAGPFDLILSAGSPLGTLADPGLLPRLARRLAAGGRVIAAEQAGQPWLALLASVEQGEAPAPRRFFAATDLAERLRSAGVEAVAARSHPAIAGGLDCVVSAPLGDETAGTAQGPGCSAPALIAALPTLFAGATAPADGLTLRHDPEAALTFVTLAEDGETDPLLVLAPDLGDGAEAEATMRARLLALGRLVIDAPVAAKPIWIVIPGGAGWRGATGQAPAQAALWAWLRTARNEYPYLGLHAVDTARVTPAEAAEVLAGLIGSDTTETEIVAHPGALHALRIRQGAAAPGWHPASATGPARAVLRDSEKGGLDDLAWHRAPLAPPAATEVVVEVEATGLNYRDVMWAMGLLPEEALETGFAGPTLGIECAGRVVAKGPAVTTLEIGDKVVAFGAESLSSHVTVDENWVGRLPESFSSEAAATAPVAFFSAFVGLHDLARLRAGETVLIHGGAGGVGLAAIQIAQWKGARVIATAGSPVKRAVLASLGVDHILDSRSLAFVEEVERITGGRGVDVVLNALAGEPMERSIGLLRPLGRFVELGKLDYYANTGVGLRAFKDNISYFGVDVDSLLTLDPERSRALFGEMLALFAEGEIAPLPLRAFEGRDVVEAFRTMQRSGHIGKIVIRPPAVAQVTRPDGLVLNKPSPGGLIVLVGGAGGLGLAMADRMSLEGAEAIALIGRSAAPSAEAQTIIARCAARGTELRYVACDVADAEALDATLAGLRKWRPLSEVYHTAMVLDDRRIPDIDRATLDRTMPVKTLGVQNLDRATRGDKLKAFVVFSSLASLIGNHGQAAYVAANGYLEAVVRARRAAGLPALAIGWGAITDAGYLTRDEETASYIKRFGGGVEFGVAQALQALDRLVAPGQTLSDDELVWISPMSWSSAVQGLRLLAGPTHAALYRLGQHGGGGGEMDELREALITLPEAKATDRLTAFLVHEVARILRVPEGTLSAQKPLAELGVDSLMAVELGLAAQQAIGDDVPLVAMSDTLSLGEIAVRMVTHLRGGSGEAGPRVARVGGGQR